MNKNTTLSEQIPKSNRKTIERGKIDAITHKYMTAHLPVLVQTLK
jgi:hypothetical protein